MIRAMDSLLVLNWRRPSWVSANADGRLAVVTSWDVMDARRLRGPPGVTGPIP